MIELTEEQRRELEQQPARVRDPKTNKTYILVTEEVYERVKALLGDDQEFVEGLYPHVMQVFGREGWNDPSMDVYNDLDPRRQACDPAGARSCSSISPIPRGAVPRCDLPW